MYEALDAIGGGRFDFPRAALLQNRHLELLDMAAVRGNLFHQPDRQRFAVRDCRLAEAKQGANLRAVVFEGAAVPGNTPATIGAPRAPPGPRALLRRGVGNNP